MTFQQQSSRDASQLLHSGISIRGEFTNNFNFCTFPSSYNPFNYRPVTFFSSSHFPANSWLIVAVLMDLSAGAKKEPQLIDLK